MFLLFSPEAKGNFFAILSGILYGAVGYFGFNALEENFTINDMLFWRFILAAGALLPFVITKVVWPSVSKRTILYLLSFGALVYGPGSLAYFSSAECLGTGMSMVIFFVFPVFVALMSWIIDGEAISHIILFSIGLILLGLSLLADNKSCGHFSFFGMVLAVLSGLGFAIYIYLGKKVKIPPLLFTFIMCLGSGVFFFILIFYQHRSLPNLPSNWHNAFMLSLFSTALPVLFLLKAVKLINSTKASVFGILEPLTTLTLGCLYLGETINSLQALGIVIVLIGALCVQCESYLRKKILQFQRLFQKCKGFG